MFRKKKNLSCVRGRQKYLSLEITVCHHSAHSASLVMPDRDPRYGFFYLPLTSMIFVCVEVLWSSQPYGVLLSVVSLFVCVEVLRPSQPNGVMSSAVSLPNHTFTGQASHLSG